MKMNNKSNMNNLKNKLIFSAFKSLPLTWLGLIITLTLSSNYLFGQVPTPGELPKKPTLLINATLHIGNGQVLKAANIGFNQGKIILIDTILDDKNKLDFEIINANGKHVYPGLIAPNTTIGLNEIDAVRSTRDYYEVGENNAHIRSIIAYNTDSRVTPTIRSNGILLAQITPSGGTISGNSSVVNLDAWNWEDAMVKMDDALHMNWPKLHSNSQADAEAKEEESNRSEKEILAISQIWSNAKTYCGTHHDEINLKYEAFRGVFGGKKKVFIHTDGAKEIIHAVQFMKNYGITPVIVGGDESYLITQFLRKNGISVILIRTHNLPSLPEDDVDLPYKLPKILHDSGVNFCLADVGSWQQRNLPFQAGTAVAYGLTMEDALMAITKNTAEILGIDKTYGTLELGKSATLVLSEGDILDMKTSKITHAWIDGRPINLDNAQKQLDTKFRQKYFGK
jgi:imidazolonepropionase-like amidohydrolase